MGLVVLAKDCARLSLAAVAVSFVSPRMSFGVMVWSAGVAVMSIVAVGVSFGAAGLSFFAGEWLIGTSAVSFALKDLSLAAIDLSANGAARGWMAEAGRRGGFYRAAGENRPLRGQGDAGAGDEVAAAGWPMNFHMRRDRQTHSARRANDPYAERRAMFLRVLRALGADGPFAALPRGMADFLFLTMDQTPEALLLERELKLARAERDWLQMDRLSKFTRTDLADAPDLRAKLDRCGCGQLFALRVADFQPPTQSGAAELRKYLRLAA